MSAASTYLEAKVLNHVLTSTGYTAPTTRYVALFNNTSGNALANLQNGTLTDEVSTANSSAYARQAVTFAAAGTTGSGLTAVTTSATNATVTFPTAGYTWGSITHVAVMDASSAGNVLFFGAVTTAKQIDVGDTFQITSGNLTVALA
jgi:hypothetical protein